MTRSSGSRTLIAICGVPAVLLAALAGTKSRAPLERRGAVVTASEGGATFTAVTSREGFYSLPELADGLRKIEIRMLGFEPGTREIAVGPGDADLRQYAADGFLPSLSPRPSETIA